MFAQALTESVDHEYSVAVDVLDLGEIEHHVLRPGRSVRGDALVARMAGEIDLSNAEPLGVEIANALEAHRAFAHRDPMLLRKLMWGCSGPCCVGSGVGSLWRP